MGGTTTERGRCCRCSTKCGGLPAAVAGDPGRKTRVGRNVETACGQPCVSIAESPSTVARISDSASGKCDRSTGRIACLGIYPHLPGCACGISGLYVLPAGRTVQRPDKTGVLHPTVVDKSHTQAKPATQHRANASIPVGASLEVEQEKSPT